VSVVGVGVVVVDNRPSELLERRSALDNSAEEEGEEGEGDICCCWFASYACLSRPLMNVTTFASSSKSLRRISRSLNVLSARDSRIKSGACERETI
jgi:hypothetical protein